MIFPTEKELLFYLWGHCSQWWQQRPNHWGNFFFFLLKWKMCWTFSCKSLILFHCSVRLRCSTQESTVQIRCGSWHWWKTGGKEVLCEWWDQRCPTAVHLNAAPKYVSIDAHFVVSSLFCHIEGNSDLQRKAHSDGRCWRSHQVFWHWESGGRSLWPQP